MFCIPGASLGDFFVSHAPYPRIVYKAFTRLLCLDVLQGHIGASRTRNNLLEHLSPLEDSTSLNSYVSLSKKVEGIILREFEEKLVKQVRLYQAVVYMPTVCSLQ